MRPEEIASAIAELAADRKAVEIVALDLRGLSSLTDYFLICTGHSGRQARAIYEGIQQGMKARHGIAPARVDGAQEATWITLDYIDVIAHVFTPQTREYYRLEQLWGEAQVRRYRFAAQASSAA